jgi:hypothetical protein
LTIEEEIMPAAMTMLSGLFLATSAGIALWQRRARSCPLHRRDAGAVAWILAAACGLTGLALLGIAALAS